MNNAGRTQRAVWENIDINVDREIFELNVFAAVSLSRLAVKHFEENGQGQLVVNSSIAGIRGIPFSGSYTGSKHALHVSDLLIPSNRSFDFLELISIIRFRDTLKR